MTIALARRYNPMRAAPAKPRAGRKTRCPCQTTAAPQTAAPVRMFSAPPVVQPKLTVGDVGDRFEQEADRVADRVMRMPDPLHTGPIKPGGPATAARFGANALFTLNTRPFASTLICSWPL